MKAANKIILYLALALAAVIICGTVGAVYGIAGRIFDFSGKDNEQMEMKRFDVGTSAKSFDRVVIRLSNAEESSCSSRICNFSMCSADSTAPDDPP